MLSRKLGERFNCHQLTEPSGLFNCRPKRNLWKATEGSHVSSILVHFEMPSEAHGCGKPQGGPWYRKKGLIPHALRWIPQKVRGKWAMTKLNTTNDSTGSLGREPGAQFHVDQPNPRPQLPRTLGFPQTHLTPNSPQPPKLSNPQGPPTPQCFESRVSASMSWPQAASNRQPPKREPRLHPAMLWMGEIRSHHVDSMVFQGSHHSRVSMVVRSGLRPSHTKVRFPSL